MAEPLKNCYNDDFFTLLNRTIEAIFPDFDPEQFMTSVIDQEWELRELKDRMYHITSSLSEQLPDDPRKGIEFMVQLSAQLQSKKPGPSFAFMFIPHYLEQFGLKYPEISLSAMQEITQFTSCEFAIRPFILRNPDLVLHQMLQWTKHSHDHVRRLASEGCRPLLPWSIQLDFLRQNPEPILPILSQLKDDPSEFVRKSVANNLNDISKDHPGILIKLVKKWKGNSERTDWILKHGSRTLLKKGNKEILQIFNLIYSKQLQINNFNINTPSVKIGNDLLFEFSVQNKSNEPALVRVEYAVYFLLSNGSHTKKVFKITEKEFPKKSTTRIKRKQSFRIITTRRYYPGLHHLAIIVNGKEMPAHSFQLVV